MIVYLFNNRMDRIVHFNTVTKLQSQIMLIEPVRKKLAVASSHFIAKTLKTYTVKMFCKCDMTG